MLRLKALKPHLRADLTQSVDTKFETTSISVTLEVLSESHWESALVSEHKLCDQFSRHVRCAVQNVSDTTLSNDRRDVSQKPSCLR